MTDLTHSARAVRAEFTGLGYVRRIKQLVEDELKSIDSHAKIEDTHYFNHSAIPDFVVTWSNERGSRDVYLRASYASVVAAHDVRKSGGPSAMFLALDAQKEFDAEFPRIGSGDIAKEASRSRSTLLTDVRAIDEISEATQGPEASPIAGLVRDNFVRAARGWIDEPRASTLVGATSEDAPRSSMSDIVRQNFDEAAALRLERTAFSDDGRSLRGRDSHTSPRWDDIKLSLDVFRLASVSLRGITRSVRIDAGESDDIRQDVQRVVESLADSYNVTDVQVVFDNPTEDSDVTVQIEFGKSLALASPHASLADLSRAAMSLLAYRTPVGGGRLESAFLSDNYPSGAES